MAKGRFIVLEGGEGTGKSTLVKSLVAHYTNLHTADSTAHRAVIGCRDPGGSPGAEAIRQLAVTGTADRWDPDVELLLYSAARLDLIRRTIRPALEAGHLVICDRFTTSTRVYQTRQSDANRSALVEETIEMFTDGIVPDTVLVLDGPVEVTLPRAKSRIGNETRFESMDVSFHQYVRDKYRLMAQCYAFNHVIIDATESIETILQKAIDHVDYVL